jgi:ribosomal protein S15P/S13E
MPTGSALPKTEDADSSPLEKDVLFELLKNQRRRHVLRYLDEHDEEATLSDLAEHVAAIENDIPESHLTSQQRKRVYVALYQCHLPILARSDVIKFNQARGLIERTSRADQLMPYLQEDPPEDVQWSTAYLGVSLVGVSAYALSMLAGGLSWLSPAVVVLFISTIVGMSLLQFTDETGVTIGELVSRFRSMPANRSA